jgi:hypothetical protein
MNKLIKILIISTTSVFFAAQTQNSSCGINRVKIKTGSDVDVAKIDTIAKQSTIKTLTSKKAPEKISENLPRTGLEFKTYKIKAKITFWKSEDDNDYHLVLQDLKDSTLTMVAEIPSPDCDEVKNGRFLKQIKSTRKSFSLIKWTNNRVKPGTYIITGVAFFDKVHGQKGVAKNGIELHPVLSITKVE